MRKLLTIAAASLALAGCTTLTSIEDYIKKNLPIACQGLDLAHNGFLLAHSARPFSQTILDSELAAYTNVKVHCDHPETVNTAAIIGTIMTTAFQINGYILRAERAGVE